MAKKSRIHMRGRTSDFSRWLEGNFEIDFSRFMIEPPEERER